jgi:ABC-type multidrug transport system ATPase subunit
VTIRDQLTYTALLRLPRAWSRARKDSEVDAVVARLRLGRCVDTPIMLVSGGERKRTNIGTELLTNPRILILDEPTSGLDSTSV